jgi:small-conductance mechanosensitive channel
VIHEAHGGIRVSRDSYGLVRGGRFAGGGAGCRSGNRAAERGRFGLAHDRALERRIRLGFRSPVCLACDSLRRPSVGDQQVQSVFRFFVYIATMLVVVFLSFHMSTQALTLLGGTAAVAVGFATKDIVASLVAGIVIIFDRPFRLGDRVAVEGYYGDIVQIGLRSVKLLTLDGNVITIPNSVFTTSVTSCGNYGVLNMKLFVDFYVDADSDVARAVAIVREAAAVSPFTYLSEPIHVGVSEQIVGNRVGVRIRLAAFVIDTKHEKDFETDISMRVLTAFREEGIKAPEVKRDSASAAEVVEKPAEFAH